MREIKFRIWDGNNKHFVYPDILEIDRGLEYQQFTGLFDKQGTEVYEGDIISLSMWGYDDPWNFRVGFGDGGFYIYTIGFGGECVQNLDSDNAKRYQVIGNIYANPELLEVSNGGP